MSVLAAIAVLALLIVVHELGHFFAARSQGIYANRFSIGFGPVIWKYQGPQTEYALRAFPLGGYVGFPDEDPDSTIPPDDPNLLKNRPILDRAIVISAGVIANLVFAYLLMVVQAGTVGVAEASLPGVKVPQLSAEVVEVSPIAAQQGVKVGDQVLIDGQTFTYRFGSAGSTSELAIAQGQSADLALFRKNAEGKVEPLKVAVTSESGIRLKPTATMKAGLQPGDVIVSAEGESLGRSLRERVKLQKLLEENAGVPLALQVQRGSQTLSPTITPQPSPTGEGKIGAILAPNGTVERHRLGGLSVFTTAATNFQQLVNDTVEGFSQLIRKFSQTAGQIAGPVAIVATGAKIAQSDASSLFDFSALISINLAIINILPLPALDGGHLAFLLLEGLRGKPLPNKIQDGVMQTGLMLLLGLGIFLIVRDTTQLLR